MLFTLLGGWTKIIIVKYNQERPMNSKGKIRKACLNFCARENFIWPYFENYKYKLNMVWGMFISDAKLKFLNS